MEGTGGKNFPRHTVALELGEISECAVLPALLRAQAEDSRCSPAPAGEEKHFVELPPEQFELVFPYFTQKETEVQGCRKLALLCERGQRVMLW